jgi:hypothetical protein
MPDILNQLIARGDLAHLALFALAAAGWGAFVMTFKELISANRRFDTFVRELARFNSRFKGD